LSAEELAEVAEATPLARWGGEEEVVKAVRLLVDSDFITGETIRVDGGRHLR
jgi:NAD(P)-dependent dehydrogenase (short-subunit alcohol dehydrogenase family)